MIDPQCCAMMIQIKWWDDAQKHTPFCQEDNINWCYEHNDRQFTSYNIVVDSWADLAWNGKGLGYSGNSISTDNMKIYYKLNFHIICGISMLHR